MMLHGHCSGSDHLNKAEEVTCDSLNYKSDKEASQQPSKFSGSVKVPGCG